VNFVTARMILYLLALMVTASLAQEGHSVNVHDVEKRLKRDLMVDYDQFIAPQMDLERPINVSAGLSVYTMDMDDQGILNSVIWFRGNWQDDRLTWNPEDYHGQTVIRLPAQMLWVPDLEIYNAEDYDEGFFSDSFLRRRNHNAIVYNTGNVLYIPPTKLKVRCDDNDYADWPWGEYDCNIKIGPWTHSSKQFDLNPYGGEKHLDMDGKEVSPMVFTEGSFKEDPLENKVYDCCPTENYQSLNFRFKVQKKWRFTADGFEKNPNEINEFKGKNQM